MLVSKRERRRQLAAGALTLLLLAVVAAGLARGGANEGHGDRVERLAARLRCPVCQSVSVADSPSQTAQAMRATIKQLVAQGRSDQQVIAWFQARYGPWILLDPPASGRTLPLWLLPAAGLVAGMLLLAGYGWHRRAPGKALTTQARTRLAEVLAKEQARAPSTAADQDEPPNTPPTPLEARKDQAVKDLLELERQVEMGEIEPGTAARLGAVYQADLAEAVAALDAQGNTPDQPPATPAARRSNRRRRVAGALVAVVAFAVAVLLPRAIVARPPGGFVSGVDAQSQAQPAAAAADNPQVTDAQLQAAVDANPEVVAMRLLLADRYFYEGKADQALAQYTEVLKRQPDPGALSHAGWLLAQAGKPQAGARLVQQSLAAKPDQPEALWFLANIQLFGLHDPKRAVDSLQRLLARGDLRSDVRSQIERLLAAARRQARSAKP